MKIYNLLILNVKLLSLLVIALLIKAAYDRHRCDTLASALYQKRQHALSLMMGDCTGPCLEQMMLLQNQLKLIDNAGLAGEGCGK